MMRCTLYALHAGICAALTAQALLTVPRNCCRLLVDAGLPNVIFRNSTADSTYQQEVQSYWSVTARLEPNCFVQPETTEQVSCILETLNDESNCQFAVRSGGHSSIRGWNNIDNGVTIDLSRLNSMLYDKGSNLLSVGPGLRWQDVYEYAELQGIMVPGARLGAVGVGGLLCGGGLSYHMHEKGLAMDSVKKYEVVLANGTIVEASQDSNTDLWLALKGSQCTFAIVTRFDLEAFSNPKLWGGVLSYSNTAEITSNFITTLKAFTDNIENYLPGTAWVYWGHNGADPEPKDTIWTGLVDTSGAANSSAYGHFISIPGKLIGELAPTKTSSLTGFSRPGNYSNIWMTCSFVNNKRLMHKAVRLHQEMVNAYGKQFGLDSDYTTQVLFQPLPVAIGKASAKMGGNITPLSEQKVNGQVLYGSIAVRDATRESFAREVLMDLKRKFCDALTAEERIDYEYINYADGTQNPIERYGKANIDRLLAAEKKYDPTLVFRRRVPGGFIIPPLPPK